MVTRTENKIYEPLDQTNERNERTGVGYLANIIVFVLSVGLLGIRCQSSSVTKGMKGWRSRSPLSRTV